MGWKDVFSKRDTSNISWKEMTTEAQISEIIERSHENPQLIFKHSTRCSISSMAKSRLEREWNLLNVGAWYLDLIRYREISNAIASTLGVEHQSPQAILLKDGIVVHDASHNFIRVSDLAQAV